MTLDPMELARVAGGRWASGTGTVEQLRSQAANLGWKEIPPRAGDPPVSNLTPVTRENARTKSLSAIHGLGTQPLHTDAAHHPQPPDMLALIAPKPNATPTYVWSPHDEEGGLVPWAAPTTGLFVVTGTKTPFLSPAYDGRRLRWDPHCMRAKDERAREAQEFLNGASVNATPHFWDSTGGVLLVDNSAALHGRGALAEGDMGRLLHRIAFWTGATT